MRVRGVALLAGGAALIAVLALGAFSALRSTATIGPAEQAERIAAELRCPTCQALSVADSSSTAAAEIRRQIAELLAEGQTPDQVRQHFVDRYGEWILLAPSSPLPWLVPPALLLAGGVALLLWIRGRRAKLGPPMAAADLAHRARIREEVEALDA